MIATAAHHRISLTFQSTPAHIRRPNNPASIGGIMAHRSSVGDSTRERPRTCALARYRILLGFGRTTPSPAALAFAARLTFGVSVALVAVPLSSTRLAAQAATGRITGTATDSA